MPCSVQLPRPCTLSLNEAHLLGRNETVTDPSPEPPCAETVLCFSPSHESRAQNVQSLPGDSRRYIREMYLCSGVSRRISPVSKLHSTPPVSRLPTEVSPPMPYTLHVLPLRQSI